MDFSLARCKPNDKRAEINRKNYKGILGFRKLGGSPIPVQPIGLRSMSSGGHDG